MKKIKSKSEERREAIQSEEKPEEKKSVKIIVNYLQKVREEATKLGIVLKEEKEIIKTLLEATFDNYRKNKIDEAYFQKLFVTGKKSDRNEVAKVLAKVQNEIKNQEMYMDYLLEKIS